MDSLVPPTPSNPSETSPAQAATGLHFERRFTREGVHPYDEVTWERRTAAIANEKGETVFEQRDCEVPAFWSQMATNVVVSKYFRGALGTPRRETSVKQMISRVVDTIAAWGRARAYFASEADAQVFQDELCHLILHQKMAFNSPVWFNLGVPGSKPQISACFINSVDDTMDSILTLAKTEGMLFKYGSGTGTNLSPLRSAQESLAGGGTASGPVSFMKGFDAFAGVIKSGGTTRRAAKMVILNADHPDIEDFITCKVSEERKAWALIEAGYDSSFTGEAYASIFFQNSNNSVRVTDEFMRAAEEDKDWNLYAVTDHSRVLKTVKARALLRLMAESAWQCGDPGIQYDTTINDWHTSSNTARINASNPCFPGDARVNTTAGPVAFADLYQRAEAGERFSVFTHRATADDPGDGVLASKPLMLMKTGVKPIVRLTFSNGRELRCTPNHRLWTRNGGYVAAIDLTIDDEVLFVEHIEVSQPVAAATTFGDSRRPEIVADADGSSGVHRTQDASTHLVSRDQEPAELVYNLTEPLHHSYIVDGFVVANCSEYMYLDNSSCNLASINLMRFFNDDGSIDLDGYRHAIHLTITAQEILVSDASYPTEKIAKNSEDYRPLGLGYANLGALLMARGVPYDSPKGRDLAACLTAVLTGEAYAQSARIAREIGAFNGYAVNRQPMLRVIGKHREAAYNIPTSNVEPDLITAARHAWDEAHELGARHGYRNAQATVLAPTGCLAPDSLVATSRGLVRLRSLGDPNGAKWQDLDVEVATDEGPRKATRFFVNGVEPVVSVQTRRGYRIRGTTGHRIKVVDADGSLQWRRLADVRTGDTLPLLLGGLVGEPTPVALPPLPDAYWTADHRTTAPRYVTPELAELVGYFMGDGSLHSKELRFCVSPQDADLADHLASAGAALFSLEPKVTRKPSYIEVCFTSVRLVMWWEACGFAKLAAGEGHRGKGWLARIPDAVLHTNNPAAYAAFVRGLFEADGTVSSGYPSFTTVTESLARDVQTLLLALGFVTTLEEQPAGKGSWGGRAKFRLRLLNVREARRFSEEVGFVSARKRTLCHGGEHKQAQRYDHIPVTREMIDRVAPDNDRLRKVLLMEHNRGAVSRRVATELLERAPDRALTQMLDFFYDKVADVELSEEDLTLDLSVPDNVTYVANGFISHNTISFLLDCDTTGVEPDIALVKYKKLVGGGMLKIVNQTVPAALHRLGYGDTAIADTIAYVDANDTIEGAPTLHDEDVAVFDCAFTPQNGKRSIAWQGHLRMMAAVQPFVSGAISKCVAGDTLVESELGLVRISSLYRDEAPDSFSPLRLDIASLDGTRTTDAFYFGGEQRVLKAHLRSGHSITGTPNHRLLVTDGSGLSWKRLDELEPGDHVATQYGDEKWASHPARFDDFRPSPPYGSQKDVRIPAEMTEELAYFLGAFAAEGHISRSNYTASLANTDEGVIKRLVEAIVGIFGIAPRVAREEGKCPAVLLSSKRVVEFLDFLGCGDRASNKRIPDAVMRSPRPMVLAFLAGLSLEAYITGRGMIAWAICLDSPRLLDDLQAILTNLGIVHSRVAKYSQEYEKSFHEVYACGRQAQKLLQLVPFMEPHKRLRAGALLEFAVGSGGTADVIPGLSGSDLYQLIPKGRSGRTGAGTGYSRQFSYLTDPRTKNVSYESLQRVATLPNVQLPEWLNAILARNLHFSPVKRIDEAGHQKVYDISVPGPHAFVANGIVNHNTVNMPGDSTVDDIERAYIDGWTMGLKALAIYRDGSKRSQPLATSIDKTTGQRVQVVERPLRRRLPAERQALTHRFEVSGHEGYITVGIYEDGTPGEIFLKMAKEGSTVSGLMDSFATAISLALQYGVPLQALVDKFSHTRFEPQGFTKNPEIPIAKSVMDYIFKWLASRFLSQEECDRVGIIRREEEDASDATPAQAPSAPATPRVQLGLARSSVELPGAFVNQSDAPSCSDCGSLMVRNGACYKCHNCGATSGCS